MSDRNDIWPIKNCITYIRFEQFKLLIVTTVSYLRVHQSADDANVTSLVAT